MRNNKFDNLKLFLILLVVIGHLADVVGKGNQVMLCGQLWIYLFHMPAFIFVAGLFAKRTINENIYQKYVPYLLVCLLMLTISFVQKGIAKDFVKTAIHLKNVEGVAWYALCMFWWHLFAVCLRKCDHKYVLAVSFALSVIAGCTNDIVSMYSLRRAFVFFPFFYMGYITDIELMERKLSGVKIKVASVIVLVAALVMCFVFYGKLSFLLELFRGKFKFTGSQMPYAILLRLLFYVVALILTVAIISIMPSREFAITKLGRRTLGIYVFHYVFIRVVDHDEVIKAWMQSGVSAPIKCIIFATVVVLITSLPIFDKCVRLLFKVRSQKNQ